jgi:hypothetical protein
VRLWLLGLTIGWCGCAGSSPLGPSPLPAPVPVASVALRGAVTATNGGQPLAAVTVAIGAQTATTDASGTFSSTVLPSSRLRAVLTGAGILPRTVTLAASSARDVTIDAIALGGAFDPRFYSQLVRNTLDGSAEPLRRWTRNPSLYLQTGTDARTLDQTEAIIREMVPQWTAGRLTVADVVRGTSTMEGQPGWITVRWGLMAMTRCGTADVGLEGGMIEFDPVTPGCSCPGFTIRPSVIRHEVGHALGFYHTNDPTDLMFVVSNQCDKPITARESYHAAIAYARPVGNIAPDEDPANVVALSPRRVY